jgi:hypothetical protein
MQLSSERLFILESIEISIEAVPLEPIAVNKKAETLSKPNILPHTTLWKL